MRKIFSFVMFLLLMCGVFGDDVTSVSVMEGQSVTLHIDTDLQGVLKIVWRVEQKNIKYLLVEIGKDMTPYIDKKIFGERLQVDNQTGSLTIKNTRIKHSGLYEAEIDSNTGTTEIKFTVVVYGAPPVIDAGPSEVKSVSVTEGESVPLNTDVQTQSGDLILWRFGEKNTLIAKDDKEDNETSVYDDVLDGRFRDRLQVDHQTGSLTITNIRITDSGLYKLKISRNSKQTLYKTFSVSVSESLDEITGIVVRVLLLFFAVGVILFCYRIIKRKYQSDTSLSPGGITVTVVRVLLMFFPAVGVILVFYMIIILLNQSDASLSPGAIAGIVVVILLVFLAVCLILYRYRTIKRKNESEESQSPEEIAEIVVRVLLMFLAAIGVILYFYMITILQNQTEESQSPDEIERIVGYVLLVFLAVGVILLCCMIIIQQIQSVEEMTVMEGEDVTLSTGVALQSDDVIEWTFGDLELIAKINRKDTTFSTCEGADGKFKDRLKVNPDTGDLTIKNIKARHTGLYKMKIISSRKTRFISRSCFQFNVTVNERIKLPEQGGSVILDTDVDLQDDDMILWTFGADDSLIAQYTKGSHTTPYYNNYNDERFRDVLELDKQTGSLTIKNITIKHCGLYRSHVMSTGGTKYRKFNVFLSVKVKEGESVTLQTDGSIQTNDLVEWSFRDKQVQKTPKDKTTLVTGTGRKIIYTWRFKDRLEMNPVTGDLTIRDIRKTDEGIYTVQPIRTDDGTSYRNYFVDVSGNNPDDLKSGENQSAEMGLE